MCCAENVQSTSSQPHKSVTYRPAGPVTAISRPVPQSRAVLTLPAHSRTVSAPRPEPRTTGSGLNPNNYPQWGNNTYKPPANTGGNRANNVGSNIVCYECGQPGHMHPNCPQLKGNVRAAAVRHEVTHQRWETHPVSLPQWKGDKKVWRMISMTIQRSKSLLPRQQTYGTMMSPHTSGMTKKAPPTISPHSCIALVRYGFPQREESWRNAHMPCVSLTKDFPLIGGRPDS
jgi:Zinc knuckle